MRPFVASGTERHRAIAAGLRWVEPVSRRALLQDLTLGLGPLALAGLLQRDGVLAAEDSAQSAGGAAPGAGRAAAGPPAPSTPRRPHFPPRAKSVIFLHMVGAPSHLDLFDHKPELKRLNGKLLPDELWRGLRLAFIRNRPSLLASPYRFRRCGESGIELSELLPHLAGVADELAVIKTLHTEHFNHAPAQLFFETGFGRFGRPSMGAWITYGLGSENHNLPAFVVLLTGPIAGAGNSLWGSGFLPSVYQGIELRSSGDPVLFLSDPPGMPREDRRRIIARVNRLNRVHLADIGDPEIATRIAQYEMAFRMQAAVPEVMDIAREPKHIHQMYGTEPGKASFANNCLLARRLVERGVRFVQLFDSGWDHHSNVFTNLPKKCREVDRPIAALIRDLKQRGLLEETLVVWGAEFGRTPMLQGQKGDGTVPRNAGRDHHKDAYTVWMAGGGVKGGVVYGATDEIGFRPVEKPMHVRDFHATLLALLGIDHERLTYRFQGRPFRLTDIGGHIARDLFA